MFDQPEYIKELRRENLRLEALMFDQPEYIKELERKNRRLELLTQTLSNRIQNLEETNVVIDREVAEIPIDFDLIPESDLNRP